jgi:hypothetical protein
MDNIDNCEEIKICDRSYEFQNEGFNGNEMSYYRYEDRMNQIKFSDLETIIDKTPDIIDEKYETNNEKSNVIDEKYETNNEKSNVIDEKLDTKNRVISRIINCKKRKEFAQKLSKQKKIYYSINLTEKNEIISIDISFKNSEDLDYSIKFIKCDKVTECDKLIDETIYRNFHKINKIINENEESLCCNKNFTVIKENIIGSPFNCVNYGFIKSCKIYDFLNKGLNFSIIKQTQNGKNKDYKSIKDVYEKIKISKEIIEILIEDENKNGDILNKKYIIETPKIKQPEFISDIKKIYGKYICAGDLNKILIYYNHVYAHELINIGMKLKQEKKTTHIIRFEPPIDYPIEKTLIYQSVYIDIKNLPFKHLDWFKCEKIEKTLYEIKIYNGVNVVDAFIYDNISDLFDGFIKFAMYEFKFSIRPLNGEFKIEYVNKPLVPELYISGEAPKLDFEFDNFGEQNIMLINNNYMNEIHEFGGEPQYRIIPVFDTKKNIEFCQGIGCPWNLVLYCVNLIEEKIKENEDPKLIESIQEKLKKIRFCFMGL